MIYFVQPVSGGHIKIGTTIRLSQRLKTLASEYGVEFRVLAVCDGSYAEEKALHQRFASLKIVNELFEPGDDLLGFIVAECRAWDGTDEVPDTSRAARVSTEALEQARLAASLMRMSLADYASEVLLKAAERDITREAKKLTGGKE